MKKLVFAVLCCSLVLIGCKTDKKTEVAAQKMELSILDKVANAHGFNHFRNVKEIAFTFNVDRPDSHSERSWVWNTITNDVTSINKGDTISYNRKSMDSTATKINGGFINDKYWLMAPFNLVWDKNNITYDHKSDVPAPISKNPMQKLTIVYGNEGGYTPGDAYDFYFGNDYMIKEWVFRKSNQAEPSLVTTWENYADINGLKIAEMHQNEDGSFKLYFTNIKVTSKNP
jgi:outer membrane lipoprotein-sorting protein